ncbi:MAG: glycosyltransferase [Gammaproteobacteria bacterium]|nr:glycosyltransferase [Gammaproteobacteria bacterium]
MKTSLIITTYNWADALRLSLQSALNQSILPDEIIIADDGSSIETKNLVDEFIANSTVKIIHSWQDDRGFRLARSRNVAIAESSFKYIVIVDGDMILDKDFIKDHINASEKKCYIQGSRVILNQTISRKFIERNYFKRPLMFSKSIKNHENGIKNSMLSKIFLIPYFQKYKGIRGCNFAFFKSDFMHVNGFNEDFITWGREDSEFIARLYNTGIKRKNLKFGGIQYHLYHNESNSSSNNDTMLKNTISNKLTWCSNGVNNHL